MMPPELLDLLQRYIRIAVLLDADAVCGGEAEAVAGQRLIVAELDKTWSEIDAFLDEARAKRLRH